ncbi:family 16 glycosylhydrolase [Archangium sp.]|jgi:beta-glucanase (GH16 family)|uniref:family 16 glycosylhydrolase n=1 Tax=Archangium sp. TaxID=1872627 RepID=UPI002EDB9DD4
MIRNVRWGLLLLVAGLLQAGCRWADYDDVIPTSDGGVRPGSGAGRDGGSGGEEEPDAGSDSVDGLDGGPPSLGWVEGPGAFNEPFDTFDARRWRLSDGWASSEDFNAGWRADHVRAKGGNLELQLDKTPCPAGCSGRPYAAGEVGSMRFQGYGRYEVRMKPARGSGTLTAFSLYTGPAENTRWDGIDISFVGLNTRRVQTSYVVNGKGYYGGVDLPFDAANAFHTYGIEWTREALHWYVDGKRVHSAKDPLPAIPGRIIMNFWPGIGPATESWMGSFSWPGAPMVSSYDNVRYGLAAPKEMVDEFETLDTWKTSGPGLSTERDPDGHVGNALVLNYNIATPGSSVGSSLVRTFETPQNWSQGNYLNFWFRGTNSGDLFRLELWDNGDSADSAERFEYGFKDDDNRWKWMNVPMSAFTRRAADGQPAGAPNDGLSLSAVRGLSLHTLGNKGHKIILDELELEHWPSP